MAITLTATTFNAELSVVELFNDFLKQPRPFDFLLFMSIFDLGIG
jgi:hypothetical protein